MENDKNRRPLKVRGFRVMRNIAKSLSDKKISPNLISIYSVAFAAVAALCFILAGYFDGVIVKRIFFVFVIIFVQMRLLCNLFDGMVAVEGGLKTPSGELFNDIPDRIADPLILIAAGYSVDFFGISGVMGWIAGILALMTAYIRTLAASIGAPVNFCGPMAKQHRMATITVACILMVVSPEAYIIFFALLLIILGSAFTVFRRSKAAYLYLEKS